MPDEITPGDGTGADTAAPASDPTPAGEAAAPSILSGDDPSPAAPEPAKEPTAKPAEGASAGGAPTDPAPAEPTTAFPDDWRTQMAGGDTKTLEKLNRYASPGEVGKALMEANAKLRQRDQVDWDSDDKTTLAKKLGVPENLDDYDLKYPYDNLPEADKAVVDKFRGIMHEHLLTPKQGQALMDAYADLQRSDEQAMQELASRLTQEGIAKVKDEYGADWNRNVQVAKTFLDQHSGGPESREDLVNLTLMDGTKLGDNPTFMKMIVNAGLATLDDDSLVISDTASRGGDIDGRYQELLSLSTTDPVKYRSDEIQGEIRKLAEIRERRKAKG